MTAERVCVLDDCDKPAHKTHPMCSMHRGRLVRHGDPTVTIAPSERKLPRGSDHPHWNAAGSYSAVHQRLRRLRGPARAHACVDCGEGARHWSLGERADGGIAGEYGPFSTDLSRYVPRCVSCHKRHDLAGLAASAGGVG